jgi:SAM-dependent methyltransferase
MDRVSRKSSETEAIGSLARLLSFAYSLANGDDCVECQAISDEIIAGGDPLGNYYARLRSSTERRDAGITFTPDRIVKSMVAWAATITTPTRVVDAGAGTGRFSIAAAHTFPDAEIIAVESDPDLALLLRATAKVLGLSDRIQILVSDFREIDLPTVEGRTLFIGNPSYVRHHKIGRYWKEWYSAACAARGIGASQLAGLHLHFFVKVAEIARDGDCGCFITSAEWLDVAYGSALRTLLANGLGGSELHVLEPTAEAFPGTMTTAAITTFLVGQRPENIGIRAVKRPDELGKLEGTTAVPWTHAIEMPRWSVLVSGGSPRPPGTIELGELCRVHRGQATGNNAIWIAGAHGDGLPEYVLKPTITAASELIAAGIILDDDSRLARVIDLPPDLDSLTASDRAIVQSFIDWAESARAADSYLARHRKPWWAIRLGQPAPIVCTYMARRPPAFVRNRVGARLLNIAHGIYPREPMTEDQLMALVLTLRSTVSQSSGRTYSGGLTKFEPREVERILVPASWADTNAIK